MTTIASVCNRAVAFTTPDATVAAAAKLMRHGHVGSLVIVEELNELARTVAREQAHESAARK